MAKTTQQLWDYALLLLFSGGETKYYLHTLNRMHNEAWSCGNLAQGGTNCLVCEFCAKQGFHVGFFVRQCGSNVRFYGIELHRTDMHSLQFFLKLQESDLPTLHCAHNAFKQRSFENR